MQCINMASLVGDDMDSTTAVASFAMHQGGVDQINIPMDTFENTLAGTAAKPATYPTEKEKPAPSHAIEDPAAAASGTASPRL
jgi:hypothetical protein